MNADFEQLLLALVAGVLPALLWLWFWRHEDKENPEPLRYVVLTFIFGMVAVVFALPIENAALPYLGTNPLVTLGIWSFVEEYLKFLAVMIVVRIGAPLDEPIDNMLYMITAALGFAALENALFLLPSVSERLAMESIVIGNLRFIGATLLHVLASGLHGTALALSFYRNKHLRRRWFIIGITIATLVHLIFNYILLEHGNAFESVLFLTFSAIWSGLIVLIVMFEKVKTIQPNLRG